MIYEPGRYQQGRTAMPMYGFPAGRFAVSLVALLVVLTTAVADGKAGRGEPVAAVVIEEEGRPPERFVAQYRVKVTADHAAFEAGTEVRLFLTAETKVVRGKGAEATRPGGWPAGTNLHF